MSLDLSAGALVNAGGALAFVLVGLLAAVSKGGGRARLLFAGTCGSLGIVMVATNLLTPGSPALLPILIVGPVLGAGFAGALAWAIARHAPRRETLAIGASGAVALVLHLAGALADPAAVGASFGAPPELAALAGRALAPFGAMMIAIAVAGAAAGAAFGPTADPRQRRALAALGFGLLAFPTYFGSRGLAYPLPWAFVLGPALILVASVVAWRPRSAGEGRGTARQVFLALVGIALAALAYAVVGRPLGITISLDHGAGGTVRTVAALVLARAILKGGLLGMEPPDLARRKGAVAAGALASLFIVAQIAQNFLAAQYGLLVGGVVAGAFLFAASPIQRAFERAGANLPGPPGPPPGARGTPAASPGKEDAYRNALRIALRDRALTDEEELHLAHLSDELGLTHRRAREIRNEVEREARGGVT